MAELEPITVKVENIIVEVNDQTRIKVAPFGVFSKVFEWLFSLLKMLGYEEIKIEVYIEDDGEGQATSTDTPSNQEG